LPQTVWEVDDGSQGPAYARGSDGSHTQAGSRVPLDVPPELRQELEVPMPDQVAVDAASGAGTKIDKVRKQAMAGNAVSLDARQYNVPPALLFSSVLDAMTALNLPVDSVDSPSGTLTTEWVRRDSTSQNTYVDSAMSLFGGGPTHERYRYVVRIFRAGQQSQLEIRTLGQRFVNKHWVNTPLKIKLANELFTAVEEQLTRRKTPKTVPVQAESGGAISGQPDSATVPASGSVE